MSEKLKLFNKRYNLHCGNQQREGYENRDKRINASDSYLMEFEIPDTVNEILINAGCLESIPKHEVRSHLDNWKKALKSGAEIKIYFTNPYAIANNLCYGKMSLPEFEKLLLENKWCSLYDMQMVTQLLTSVGLKIKTSNLSDIVGVIYAIKTG